MKEISDEVLQKVIDEEVAKVKQRQAYFESPAMLQVFEVVKDYLKDNDCLDNEDMLYFPERYPVTGTEFSDLFHCLELCVEDKRGEPDNTFPCEVWEYNGVLFRLMMGQGSLCQAWNKERYEDWRHELATNGKGPK